MKPATKPCTKCGLVLPLAEFYPRYSHCKECELARVTEYRARKRAEMGDEAWLVLQREIVQRHRQRTGNRTGRAYNLARRRAIATLIARHSAEFESLLRQERWAVESGVA